MEKRNNVHESIASRGAGVENTNGDNGEDSMRERGNSTNPSSIRPIQGKRKKTPNDPVKEASHRRNRHRPRRRARWLFLDQLSSTGNGAATARSVSETRRAHDGVSGRAWGGNSLPRTGQGGGGCPHMNRARARMRARVPFHGCLLLSVMVMVMLVVRLCRRRRRHRGRRRQRHGLVPRAQH